MKKLILPFFCFIHFFLRGQKLTYDVFLFGDKIGSVKVERRAGSDSTMQYMLQGSTEATVFFVKRRSYQNYLVTYKGSKLQKVDAVNTVNDESVKVNISWDINRYVIKRNEKYTQMNEPVTFSTLCIYFKQPVPGEKIFSERLAEYFTMKKTEDGALEYILSDGVRNIFTYKGDTPVSIQMKKSIVTVEMRLVKVENQQD